MWHKYLWLGRPERKPISFYRDKEAVNTFHLVPSGEKRVGRIKKLLTEKRPKL